MAISTVPQSSTAVADVAVNREVAEVQAAVILARKFPRDPVKAMDRILVACQRPTLAATAVYQYNRGGSDVSGPSIRLAEAIAQGWGNIQFGVRELDQRNGESTVEAYAWDLESNVRVNKVFQVRHERHTKKGAYALSDPRDIYEMVANQGARRMRACVLAVIPGDVVEAAVREVDKTLAATVKITPERIKSMLEKFAEIGVGKDQIEKRIQRRVDAIQPAQIISLGKILNSIKDGISSPKDWFEAIEGDPNEEKPSSGVEAAKAAIRGRKKQEPEMPPQPEQTLPVESGISGDIIVCPYIQEDVATNFCNDVCADRKDCKAWTS